MGRWRRGVADRERIRAALASYRTSSVLVLGDLMLDRFVWGEVTRISPEAPVPVVEIERETAHLGGAANVAANLRALGCEVMLSGIVGEDPAGEELIKYAQEQGIRTTGVAVSCRPTTTKTRIIARGQQVVRVDREEAHPLKEPDMERILACLEEAVSRADAVVVSDYAKGVVSRPVIERLVSLSRPREIPVLVDPKPVNRSCYHGVTALTPNLREAEAMAGFPIPGEQELARAAESIRAGLGAQAVLVTLGPQGMALFETGAGKYRIPTMAREVFDVTGAGDTVIAALTAGLVRGLSLREAACFANIAAGIVVGKVGTATVTVKEIEAHIKTWDLDGVFSPEACRDSNIET